MPSFGHRKLIDRIASLDAVPTEPGEYSEWIKAAGHLELLRINAREDELIVYGSGDYTFVSAAVVSEDSLFPVDQEDLLGWNDELPPRACAGYNWGGGRDDVWVERHRGISGSKALKHARHLVFSRDFDWAQEGHRLSYELLQEFSHVAEIHWVSDQHAFCQLGEHGDLERVVSITPRAGRGEVELVSFRREQLEQYLAASGSTLVRMFDFTLRGRDFDFTGWPDGPEDFFSDNDCFFYKQKIDPGKAAYTRGVQIVRLSQPNHILFSSIKGEELENRYAHFIVHDWRNSRVVKISTDPSETTSYFSASGNALPFDVSPAFFRPEVLSKYKADRDKYTVDEMNRTVSCRGAWQLRGWDRNDAGQIFAYICYLRRLPYQEQQYWASFNEEPKAGISERAVANDFEGTWVEIRMPLQDVLSVIQRWKDSDVAWWDLREKELLGSVSTPLTDSRDEWAQACEDLVKLIIEGFQVKVIRKTLEGMSIQFGKEEKSLGLIEKVLWGRKKLGGGARLSGLREVQEIRSKVASHAFGSEAGELVRKIRQEHGTYQSHFESMCGAIANELKMIEEAWS